MDGIAESGIAVEVSTAGLRKRARELYPAPAFLEMCLQAGAPVSLSSDAHSPQEVGADYERALELLSRLDVRELCVFDHRERRLEPLGAAAPPGHAVPPGQAASPGQVAPPGQAASRAAGGGNS